MTTTGKDAALTRILPDGGGRLSAHDLAAVLRALDDAASWRTHVKMPARARRFRELAHTLRRASAGVASDEPAASSEILAGRSAARSKKCNPASLTEQDYATTRLAEREVAKAPPLRPEQITALRAIVSGANVATVRPRRKPEADAR